MSNSQKVSDERLAEMLAGIDGVTQGPWQVVMTEHPWTLPERELMGLHMPAQAGNHIERRIFTTWDHPQAHSPEMVVNRAIGVGMPDAAQGVHFVSIREHDAAHIARLDPATMRSILEELQFLHAAPTPDAPDRDPTNLLSVIADIREKSGLGAGPMLSELADAVGAKCKSPTPDAHSEVGVQAEPVARPANFSGWKERLNDLSNEVGEVVVGPDPDKALDRVQAIIAEMIEGFDDVIETEAALASKPEGER